YGLLNRIVPHGQVLPESLDLANRIADNATLSVRRMKATAWRGLDMPVATALRLDLGPNPYLSEDRKEGIKARLEKRKPVWRGPGRDTNMTRPKVVITDETLRDGLQIERLGVSLDEKLKLIDMLVAAGVNRLVVGAFVNPKWSPQMADTEQLVRRLKPRDGVQYFALALNDR